MLPTLFPFQSEKRWLEVLDSFFAPSAIANVQRLLSKGFIPLEYGTELASFLGISPKLLTHMVKQPEKYYNSFRIRKSNGRFRDITAPRVFLKTVQRYILDCILSIPEHPVYIVGFRRGFNSKHGASIHQGCRFLWNIDLENFFPSISKQAVFQQFKSLGYPERAAYFLAGLCCLDGKLPQGAPTSPALSNLIFRSADERISGMCTRNGIAYSRYADDLSFSSPVPVTAKFRSEIVAILRSEGYELNESKTRLMGPAVRREVTGLTVDSRISIPRARRRKLRAYFHRISLDPNNCGESRARALGFACWVMDLHAEEGRRYYDISMTIPLSGNQANSGV